MIGRARFYQESRFFGVIDGGDGVSYFVIEEDIQADQLGRRFLLAKEQVQFDPSSSPRHDHTAVNIVPLDRPYADETITEEICIVEAWNGRFGFAKRPIGGRLYICVEQIVTLGTIRVGGWIKCLPAPSSFPSWQGLQIQIFI